MSAESDRALTDKALAKVKAVQITPRPDIFQSLETAFLAFLASKSRPETEVPLDRRVFLTVNEAAAFTGLPLSYLRKLIADGTIKAVKAGKTWRVPRAELEELP